ncbi:unnamed protein product [Linum trigynum]
MRSYRPDEGGNSTVLNRHGGRRSGIADVGREDRGAGGDEDCAAGNGRGGARGIRWSGRRWALHFGRSDEACMPGFDVAQSCPRPVTYSNGPGDGGNAREGQDVGLRLGRRGDELRIDGPGSEKSSCP